MRYTLAVLLIIIISILSSCSSLTLKEPTLERIENVEIKEMSKERIDMNANLVINNPNAVSIDLASANLEVLVDKVVIAHIKQTLDATMPAQSDFIMPVNITMDLSELYKSKPLAALSKSLQIMTEKKLQAQLKGNIKAGKGAAKITVEVDQVEIVKF